MHSASEDFQKTVSSIIFDIQCSANSEDDILIWEKTLAEDDNRLRKVLLKVSESSLILNKSKCQFRKNSFVFLVLIISPRVLELTLSKLTQ